MVLHFAGNDPRGPPPAQAKIEHKFSGREEVYIYLYPDAEHGFNRFGYPPYHESSAALAWQRPLELFPRMLCEQEM